MDYIFEWSSKLRKSLSILLHEKKGFVERSKILAGYRLEK